MRLIYQDLISTVLLYVAIYILKLIHQLKKS